MTRTSVSVWESTFSWVPERLVFGPFTLSGDGRSASFAAEVR